MPTLTKNATEGVPVSEAAVIARLNRKLAREGWERVKTARNPGPGAGDLGRHYLVDMNLNFIVCARLNLEDYAREEGVLKPHERLEQ